MRWYLSQAPERPPHKLDGITIYDQSTYTLANSPDWKLGGYARRDLALAGCGIFSFAHLLQWLEGTQQGDDLLRELVAVCSDPNGNYQHVLCTHDKAMSIRDVYNEAYGHRIRNLPLPERTYDQFRAFFNDSSVRRGLRLWYADHRCLAIEEKMVDGVSYIHIIDSNWGTYFYRSGLRYFSYEDGRMVEFKYAKGTYGMGSDYWLRTHDVIKMQLLDAWESLSIPAEN